MQPTLKRAENDYKASAKQRSLLTRATPAFWLGLVLVSMLLCTVTYSGARTMFRTRYDAVPVPKAAAILLPTSAPVAPQVVIRPVATGIEELVWTVQMSPLSNGQYMVPETVKAQLQSTWEAALTTLDSLPWERFTPDTL